MESNVDIFHIFKKDFNKLFKRPEFPIICFGVEILRGVSLVIHKTNNYGQFSYSNHRKNV